MICNKLTIDERIVIFKERNKIKFFIKPIKWVFKIYVLVDAINTYAYNFIMESGQENKNLILKDKTFSFTEIIVLSLLEGLENSRKKVFLIHGILLQIYVENYQKEKFYFVAL